MAFEVHTAEDFEKYTIVELKQKRIIANFAIKTAREELDKDDRAPRALDHYLSERKAINETLRQKLYKGGPPAQSIGLKPVNMAGQSGKDTPRKNVVSMEDILKIYKGV